MEEVEFKETLEGKTSPQILWVNAPRIYDFLSELFETNCYDSLLREWSFQWWEEKTGRGYDEIYDYWLNPYKMTTKE